MSRSIHATRASLARLLAGEAVRAEAADRERRALHRKREMKHGAATARRPRERTHTAPETIPVVVAGAGPHAHFPAGEDDVRELLRRLPRGVTDGLARVEMRLGAEAQAALVESDPRGEKVDPLTGRLSYPRFPGVWTGRILGRYRPPAAAIELYAYVWDAARPLPAAWMALLRLEALSVLAHEVAHHHDHTERVARGRWTATDREAVERYAEAMQHRWTHAVVLPYLRERHAAEIVETEGWVARHGGIALPFESLAEDPRITGWGGLVHAERLLWNMREALQNLADEVERGEPEWACRTGFARELYFQSRYDDALAVVGGVLDERPGEPRALLLKGDVFARQGRHSEALEIGRALVGRDPLLDDEAWQLVADACEELGMWAEAEAALAVRLELAEAECRVHRLLLQRAEIRIRSGDLAGAARDLDAIESDRSYILRRVEKLRAALRAAAAADEEGSPKPVACAFTAAAPRPVVREGGLRVVVAADSSAP